MQPLEVTTEPMPAADAEPGTTHIPIAPAMKNKRFIQTLHIPSQAMWWSCLTAYAWISQRNLDTVIITKEAFEPGKEKQHT